MAIDLHATQSDSPTLAPGARIIVRSEEWLVRTAEPSADGGKLIVCQGVSELVRGTTGRFLTKLEGEITVLDPAKTELVADSSGQFTHSLLHMESLRLRSVRNDARIRFAHQAAMDTLDFQFDPARIALKQPRPRIFIADNVGLGKTLEAGILATELIQRGRGKRILVITLKSMLTQFQKEWWSRFTIPLVRLDSVGLARVRDRIPANHNPFNYYDRTIISMDTLKGDDEYRYYLEKAYWDIIVVDECHNVAMRAGDRASSLRSRLARLLAGRSDALILLSATPHDGSATSFASLIHLLDKTVIPDPKNYTREDFEHRQLVVRRFRKDVRDQIAGEFPERITRPLDVEASPAEERAYTALLAIPFTQKGRRLDGTSYELQRIGMQKALFSSPAAAIESTTKRLGLLATIEDPGAAVHEERRALDEFLAALQGIDARAFSKYQLLLSTLEDPADKWSAAATDRLVIFSERIETLRWLQANLARDLGLKEEKLAILHGGMPDTDQQALVERFGLEHDRMRVLLCSDVASEGLNLHFCCHRLIHFDMPWSLMTFQQRNGRVDRFGQKHRPIITYLQTLSANEKIRGDAHILRKLQEKDEQANQNLGDPSAFLDVYDEEAEVDKVSKAMASGMGAQAFDEQMEQTAEVAATAEVDMFSASYGETGAEDAPGIPAAPLPEPAVTTPSLFGSHFAFARAALEAIGQGNPDLQWSATNQNQVISLTAPRELEVRLRQIPREVQAPTYVMSASVPLILKAMEEARKAKKEEGEESWPTVHYLWPQNPIFEWLMDCAGALFRGHKAPCIASSLLAPGEMAVIIAGTVPNRKGRPVVTDWQAVVIDPGGAARLEEFDTFAKRAGIAARNLPNRNQQPPGQVANAVPLAVATMRRHMVEARQEVERSTRPVLERHLADLAELKQRQLDRVSAQLQLPGLTTVREKAAQDRLAVIDQEFEIYRQWIHDTMETEPQPFLEVVAAVHNIREDQ